MRRRGLPAATRPALRTQHVPFVPGGRGPGEEEGGRGRSASAPRGGAVPRARAPRRSRAPSPPPRPTRRPRAPAPPLASPGDMQMSPAPISRAKPPAAQWTPPAQTRGLRLSPGRKRNLWPYLLLFPRAAEANVLRGPPPPIRPSRPPSLASGAAPPSQGRSPQWRRGSPPRWSAMVAVTSC